MATIADLLKKIHKDHGESIAVRGNVEYKDLPRIPTGIFAVDLAMGGGFPQGKCSIVYGPESSNKTNIVLCCIREAQRMWPTKSVVFVDAEHALDLKWAAVMGVDVSRLIVIQPEFAEQAVDFIESFIMATDVSMVVLDSIAALTTAQELKNSAETAVVGGATLSIGKLYRKVTIAFQKMKNEGQQAPAFIAINQIRSKVGVVFGNPETMPGGNAPKFAASMILRVYGKNILDKKVSAVMPAYKEVNCVIQKWKCPIVAISAVYQMQMIEAQGRKPGFISDWNTLSAYMKELDYLTQAEKGGWLMNGVVYKTLIDCKDALYGNADALADMKQSIIAELVDKGTTIEATGEIPDDTPGV